MVETRQVQNWTRRGRCGYALRWASRERVSHFVTLHDYSFVDLNSDPRKIRLALRGHRVHPLAMPACLDDIAAACGLAMMPLTLTEDEFRQLQQTADEQGIGWEEYVRRIVVAKLQEDGTYDPRLAELPRP